MKSSRTLKAFWSLRIADVNSLCAIPPPNHDLLPNTPYLLAHRCETSACQTITKCEQSDAVLPQWRLDPSTDSEAKLVRHLPSDWWHSQNPSTFLHWPDYMRVCMLAGVCLCGTVEVIISSGRRDFLVVVVVPRGAVPSRNSQLVSLNSPPPSAVPWAQLICYSLLNFTRSSVEEALLRPSHLLILKRRGEVKESLVRAYGIVYRKDRRRGKVKGGFVAFAAVDKE